MYVIDTLIRVCVAHNTIKQARVHTCINSRFFTKKKCLRKSVNFLPTNMVPRSRKQNKWSKPTRFKLWNHWVPKQAVLFVIASRKVNAELEDVFLGETLSCPSFKQYPWNQTWNNRCDISFFSLYKGWDMREWWSHVGTIPKQPLHNFSGISDTSTDSCCIIKICHFLKWFYSLFDYCFMLCVYLCYVSSCTVGLALYRFIKWYLL